jgi:hypothetical protein
MRGAFTYHYQLSPKFRLGTGIQYDRRTYQLNTWSNLRWGNQHDGRGGFNPLLPSGEKLDGYLISHFAGVPLNVSYTPGRGSLRPYFGLGVTPGIHLSQKRRINGERITAQYPNPESGKFHLFGQVMAGLSISLDDHWSIQAQLAVERDFTALETSFLNEKLYGAALQLGITRSLIPGLQSWETQG